MNKKFFHVRQFAEVELTFNYAVQLMSLDFFQPFFVIFLSSRVGNVAPGEKKKHTHTQFYRLFLF